MAKKKQTKTTKDQSNTADNEHTKLSPKSIKTLEDAIKNIHAEIDFASRSFSSNSDNAAKGLNSTIDSLNVSLKSSEHNLEKYDNISKILDSQTNTLSLLPKKVEERLALLPNQLEKSIDSHIPQIARELLDSQTKQNELIQKSFEKSIESFEAKSSEIITKFSGDMDHYQSELVKITELSSRRRIQRLLTTLIIAGVFSALVSGISSYYINSKFPHSVELHDNGSVTVQNSQVLVVDPKSPHNKGKLKKK
jgi:hypothetical protein